jgi:hypothetical protein
MLSCAVVRLCASYMARRSNYLSRWEVALYVTAAVLLLPAGFAYDWLHDHRPRLALAVYILLNIGFLTLVASLACCAWLAVFWSYQLRRERDASDIRTLFRIPVALYFATLLTIGVVGGLIHLVSEVLRRAI